MEHKDSLKNYKAKAEQITRSRIQADTQYTNNLETWDSDQEDEILNPGEKIPVQNSQGGDKAWE